MAIFTQDSEPLNPAVGDIWVMTNGYRQIAIVGGATPLWQRFQLSGLTADKSETPPQGRADFHLGKRGAGNWDFIWVEPTQGILYRHEQEIPDDEWHILHNLRQQLIDVTVLTPGNFLDPVTKEVDPSQTEVEQTIVVPEIEYSDSISCVLTFVHPVSGTAFCRR